MHETPATSPARSPAPHPASRTDAALRSTDERTAPDAVLYEERLSPSVGVWIVALMLAALTTLVFAPIDIVVGVIAAVVFFGVEATVLLTTTPRLQVREHTLQVGRAQIERRHLGEVTGHRGDDARMERGPRLHGLAYVTVRGWISPVVRIQLTDARDRTPYWLTSTRHPEALVAALGGRMATGEPAAEPETR